MMVDMNEAPRFRVVKRTRYGPQLVRNRETMAATVPAAEATEKKEVGILSPQQREALRAVIMSFGISVLPMKQLDTQSNQEGESAVPYVAVEASGRAEQADTLDSLESLEPLESLETAGEEDLFQIEIENYKAEISALDLELADEYASKPVLGAEEYDRKSYIQEQVTFAAWNPETGKGVPQVIQDELRRMLPGLCLKESRFKADAVSKAGAKGIFQIMPTVWKHYGGQPGEEVSLKKQVAVVGEYISDLYKQLNHHLGRETMGFLQAHYPDDESFQRDLLVPLLINSYNVGTSRMAEAVNLYLEQTSLEDMPKGKDLFIAIANFAEMSNDGKYLDRYNVESREYVPKVYALLEAFEQKKQI